MKLDRSRPYGTVYGGAGVAYEQDGLQFNSLGDLVGELPVADQPEHKAPSASSLARMSAGQLKIMVESFGGEYSNRKQAISFLKGHGG